MVKVTLVVRGIATLRTFLLAGCSSAMTAALCHALIAWLSGHEMLLYLKFQLSSMGIFRETLVWAFEFEVSRTCYPRREISVIWIEEGDLKLSGLWTFLSVIWIVDFSIGYLDRREISVIWIVDFSIVPLSVVPGKPAKDPFFLEPPKPNFSEAMASCPKEDIPNFKELLQEENFYLTTEVI
ncbi:hypothetical protein FXO37_23620 [Capsicum annuum]|nr:hypothetical protein FXO37_23620 [Capsicum annuum]